MSRVSLERRLATILAADIVGYSRLIEANEPGTLSAIKALRSGFIDSLLGEYRGRIVKLMGDGLIVEFASPVNAVAFAAALQKQVPRLQRRVPPLRRIVFRIGVNLGDVVADGEDLLGHGVNVAARLEQLCEPGGILISGSVYDQVKGKLGLMVDFAGEQRVKNISAPVRTYRVSLDGRGPSLKRRALRFAKVGMPIAAAVLTLIVGSVLLLRSPATSRVCLNFPQSQFSPALLGSEGTAQIIRYLDDLKQDNEMFVYDNPGEDIVSGDDAARSRSYGKRFASMYDELEGLAQSRLDAKNGFYDEEVFADLEYIIRQERAVDKILERNGSYYAAAVYLRAVQSGFCSVPKSETGRRLDGIPSSADILGEVAQLVPGQQLNDSGRAFAEIYNKLLSFSLGQETADWQLARELRRLLVQSYERGGQTI